MSEKDEKIPFDFYLYTAWGWFVAILGTLVSIPFVYGSLAVCPFLDHDRRLVLPVNQTWCRTIALLEPLWRTEVRGLEHIDPDQSYIIASNHESAVDILLLAHIDVPFRWVAKHELYTIPIFGWMLWCLGHLSIKRGSAASRRRLMARAVRTLEAGMSILIFPEGTRTRTGEFRPFKPGGFLVARKAGKPVLPVLISGTFDVMPPHSLILHKRIHAIIEILEPVEVDADTPEELDDWIQDLRRHMIEEKRRLDRESWIKQQRWILSLSTR